jgi:hypothetical protein
MVVGFVSKYPIRVYHNQSNKKSEICLTFFVVHYHLITSHMRSSQVTFHSFLTIQLYDSELKYIAQLYHTSWRLLSFTNKVTFAIETAITKQFI